MLFLIKSPVGIEFCDRIKMKTRRSLYAYAVRKSDGSLSIVHSYSDKFRVYKIPVSSEARSIQAHGSLLVGSSLENQLVDIAPLVESGVLSSDSLINIDLDEFRSQIIRTVNMPSKF